MAAAQIKPIPSVHEITAQKDSFLQEIQKESLEEQTQWGADHPRPTDPAEITKWNEEVRQFLEEIQQRLTAKIDERNAAIERDYQVKVRGQQKMAVNLSRISPASALMFSSMSLAKTGISEYERFLSSIRTYKPIFTKWINERMIRTYNLSGETFGDSFSRMLPDLVLMAVLIILFFVGAFVSFSKYDVR